PLGHNEEIDSVILDLSKAFLAVSSIILREPETSEQKQNLFGQALRELLISLKNLINSSTNKKNEENVFV
ncbi:MAG: hypothetical protein MHPSP_001822, partial [Paramarteilia canceri]